MREQKNSTSIFVKVNEYKEILDVLDMVKGKINEIRDTLNGINNLRNEEDSEVSVWNSTIDEIEKKIEDIDSMIFESG